MNLMLLNLKQNKKGIYLLSLTFILVVLLLSYIALETTNAELQNKLAKKIINSSNLTTDQSVFENNIYFILTETIEEMLTETQNTPTIIAKLTENLTKYLLVEGINANLTNNITLALDLGNDNNYLYKINVLANIKKTEKIEDVEIVKKIPIGYTISGVYEK